MEGLPFEFVCSHCLAEIGALEAEELPSRCGACGALDPWVGPVAMPSGFALSEPPELAHSPFYMAAVAPAHVSGGLPEAPKWNKQPTG